MSAIQDILLMKTSTSITSGKLHTVTFVNNNTNKLTCGSLLICPTSLTATFQKLKQTLLEPRTTFIYYSSKNTFGRYKFDNEFAKSFWIIIKEDSNISFTLFNEKLYTEMDRINCVASLFSFCKKYMNHVNFILFAMKIKEI